MIIRLAAIILIGSTLSAYTSFLDKIRYTDKYPRQFDEKNNTVIIHTHFDRDLNLLKPSQPFLTFQVPGGTWVRPGRGGALGIDIAEKDGAMTLFTPAGHRVRFRWHWLGSQIYAKYENKMLDTYVWMSGKPAVETGKKPAIRSHVIWERHRFLTKNKFIATTIYMHSTTSRNGMYLILRNKTCPLGTKSFAHFAQIASIPRLLN